MLKIAISGNIASGKTSVGNIIKDYGYKVFDTDTISHEILEDSAKEIEEIFKGYDIKNNETIDRKKIGKIVFSNQVLKQKLEDYIHPRVKNKIIEIFKNNENEEKAVFILIPLLFEAGFEALFDKIIFVYTEEKIQLKRLIERDFIPEEYALKKINSQQDVNIKKMKSDFVIENNSTLEELKSAVKNVLSSIC